MRRKIFTFFAVLGLLTASFLSAEATSISGVSKYTTSSQMMKDMSVTVTFADTTTWTGNWKNLDSDTSGVSGSGWSFTNDAYSTSYDDTYWNDWNLMNSTANEGITSITIDGISADVMFDIWWKDKGKGTTDSEYGKAEMATDWSYTNSDAISLNSAAPVGDLWGSITLTYSDATNGFTGTAAFKLDTDKTLSSETPEPATLTLFGLGLMGLGVYGRKRNLI